MMVDCSRVHTEGPWIIMEHDFKPSEAGEVATTLWVKFSQLPIEYYNKNFLFHIAKAIGKPLKCGKVGHRKEYCSSNKSAPESAKATSIAIANGHRTGLDQATTASSSGRQSNPDRE
ncbi:hypothetical protein LOK49_LG06G00994 [Camellia lanceoleosa]|uniref:Uncharacterized protein n=1 Tax=Camellia lanceoleosa TaxID=1840588 RepID=A0ACC0HEW0_9ERIC|nr:hypothetical protein LOK49_LG06G00994 [Camellia lanceoleosa]